jgi:catalase
MGTSRRAAGVGRDLAQVVVARKAALALGMVPLLVAPLGGKIAQGKNSLDVQRTYATARSVEFDAVLVIGAVPDDPRADLLIDETFRHAKALAATGEGTEALIGLTGRPGVVEAPDAAAAVQEIATLLASHRVWERGAE